MLQRAQHTVEKINIASLQCIYNQLEDTYRQAKLIKKATQIIDLRLEQLLIIVPKAMLVSLFVSDSCSLLSRAGGHISQQDVRPLDVFDQILITDSEAYSPPCSIKCFAHRSNGNGAAGNLRAEGR